MNIIKKIEAGEKIKIAFLGDSITQGCFEGDPVPEDEKYVYHSRVIERLKTDYPQMKCEKINAGIGGNTAGMGLYRMETDVLSKKPDFCVVCFGLNDTAFCALNKFTRMLPFAKKMLDEMGNKMDSEALELLKKGKAKAAYTYSLEQILMRLKDAGIETLLLLPNRMCKVPMSDKKNPYYFLSEINSRMVNNGKMDEMMEAARNVAAKYQVPVADGYARWIELEKKGIIGPESYVNGINHPSRELHVELAEVIYQEMIR